MRKNHVDHVRGIKVALRFGHYQASANCQGWEDLEHVCIKTDGVAEHNIVLLGCNKEEVKMNNYGQTQRCLVTIKGLIPLKSRKDKGTKRRTLKVTYSGCTCQQAKVTNLSDPCEQPFLPWVGQ